MNMRKSICNACLSLIALLQLIACASTSRKQVETWDVSGIRSIAIIAPTTMKNQSKGLEREDSEFVKQFSQMLYELFGSKAKAIIQESGKFTLVTDSKQADAILDCEFISVNRERFTDRNSNVTISGYEYNVVYNIFLKRTSDGVIIGDSAGFGQERHGDSAWGRDGYLQRLLHTDHLKEALGIGQK